MTSKFPNFGEHEIRRIWFAYQSWKETEDYEPAHSSATIQKFVLIYGLIDCKCQGGDVS
jgi:hypothetical protein